MLAIQDALLSQFKLGLQFLFPQTDVDPAALHASAGPVASIPVVGKVQNAHSLGRLVKRYPGVDTNHFACEPAPIDLCVRNDQDWTIAAVVKPKDLATNYGIYGSGLDWGNYFGLFTSVNGECGAIWKCAAGEASLKCPGIATDQWALIACSYEAATKTLRLSVNDGVPVPKVLVGPSWPVGRMAIGNDTIGAVLRFQGDMSTVAKWGRILTAGERAAMYCNGAFPGM